MNTDICPDCGIDRNRPAGDPTEVCYCRPKAAIDRATHRETVRDQIARIAENGPLNSKGPLGRRMIDRVLI